jgi:hypothetical protein
MQHNCFNPKIFDFKEFSIAIDGFYNNSESLKAIGIKAADKVHLGTCDRTPAFVDNTSLGVRLKRFIDRIRDASGKE